MYEYPLTSTSPFFIYSQFTGLYLVSLVVILIGFIAFNSVPTPTDLADPAASPSSICEEGYDPAAIPKDLTNREVAVNITADEEEQQECGETEEGLEEKQRRRGKKKRASQSLGRGSGDKDVVAAGRSTKM